MRFLLAVLVWTAVSLASVVTDQAQVPMAPAAEQSAASPPPPLDSQTRDALLALHKSLVEIESITGNERAEVAKDRYNVIAYPGEERETKILVSSHIDTVPPFWPYELHSGDGSNEIWGRGSVDAKACVAAQTIAALSLVGSSEQNISASDMSLLFVVGEEKGGDGMRFFSRHKPTNYAAVIFGEPTEGKLAAGHKGFMAFSLLVTGKAAHSGYPWLGVSANDLLVEALNELLQLSKKLPKSDKYGETTLNIGYVNGGVAPNVVAETAEADIAVRIAAGTPQELRDMISDALTVLQKKAEEQGGKLEIAFREGGYAPQDIDTDVDGFETMTVNYGTDIPNLSGNHKRYLYGPGTIFVAHSDHEHLKVTELEQAVVDYKKLILAALKS